MSGRHAQERVWTLAFLDAVIDGRPEASDVDPRVAAYVRQLSQIYDRQTTLRLAHEHIFGLSSPSARAIEIEPGRRVPYLWDRHLVEPWQVRKARQAAERTLRDLQNAGLAHG
jgi:hypothetical protein